MPSSLLYTSHKLLRISKHIRIFIHHYVPKVLLHLPAKHQKIEIKQIHFQDNIADLYTMPVSISTFQKLAKILDCINSLLCNANSSKEEFCRTYGVYPEVYSLDLTCSFSLRLVAFSHWFLLPVKVLMKHPHGAGHTIAHVVLQLVCILKMSNIDMFH